MKRIYLLFSLLIGCIYLHAAIYNVMDFGAKADGKTIDSPAINRAIEVPHRPEEAQYIYLRENMRVIPSG